jgi:membrane protein YqaA with SNARE-associated domain
VIDSLVAALQSDFGVYFGTLLICFVGGLIPLVNCEVYIVAAARFLVTSDAQIPALILLASAGQMAAKVLLYYSAAGALRLPVGRHRAKIDKVRERIEAWRNKPKAVLFLSSAVGFFPPFYVVTLLSGALGIGIRSFIVIGFAGRVLHFAAFVVPARWL